MTKNPEGNLTPKQIDFTKTIHSSGNDLLMLINDILDLSKIESGTVVVEGSELRLDDLHGYVSRTFTHSIGIKECRLPHPLRPTAAEINVHRDAKRLQQIIKNLLSNAFKFTHHGARYAHRRDGAALGWSASNEDLNRASDVLAFRSRPIPASASHRTSSRSSSRHSNKPTAQPAANTAARVWAWPSAANSPARSAVKSAWFPAPAMAHLYLVPAGDLFADCNRRTALAAAK